MRMNLARGHQKLSTECSGSSFNEKLTEKAANKVFESEVKWYRSPVTIESLWVRSTVLVDQMTRVNLHGISRKSGKKRFSWGMMRFMILASHGQPHFTMWPDWHFLVHAQSRSRSPLKWVKVSISEFVQPHIWCLHSEPVTLGCSCRGHHYNFITAWSKTKCFYVRLSRKVIKFCSMVICNFGTEWGL